MFNTYTVINMLIYNIKKKKKKKKKKHLNKETIEWDPIIIKYIFTVVTTNYILLYDINIIFWFHFKHGDSL